MADEQATIRVRTVRVVPLGPGGAKAKPFLVVELDIACSVCGEAAFLLAGHHIATLASHFAQIVKDYPDLVGGVGEITSSDEW